MRIARFGEGKLFFPSSKGREHRESAVLSNEKFFEGLWKLSEFGDSELAAVDCIAILDSEPCTTEEALFLTTDIAFVRSLGGVNH